MRPAFDSTLQASAFALLLLLFLVAPWLSVKNVLPDQKQTYTPASIRWGEYWWLRQPLFEETNDIDIAFVGSSRMHYAVDAPYVQQQFDKQLGRKTVIESVCCFGNGFDRLCQLTRDLLARRRVKILVFYDECSGAVPFNIHRLAPFYLAADGVALPSLPAGTQEAAYYTAMTRLPGDVREWLGGRLPAAFEPSPTPYAPQTGVTPADFVIFNSATSAQFAFSQKPLLPGQIYYAKQFARLARQHGCQLVAIHIPLPSVSTSPVITESRNWSDLLHTPVCLAGIPEARLFSGLSPAQVKLLYTDPLHLNENGRNYFTHLITPVLLRYYESHALD